LIICLETVIDSVIKQGETFDETNIWVKRPRGGDYTAEDFQSLLGRTAALDIPANTQLRKTQVGMQW
jgi:sialic acid synthase SpsE